MQLTLENIFKKDAVEAAWGTFVNKYNGNINTGAFTCLIENEKCG